MLVSVVIPVKNQEKLIRICLESLKNSKRDSIALEIIVVDNGSTDKTVSVVEEFGDLCRIFIKPDLTISGLRNFGVSVAKGSIVGFVDSDVEVKDNWLINIVKSIKVNNADCVTGRVNIPTSDNWVMNAWYLNRCYKKGVCEVHWAVTMNMGIKKSEYLRAGGFNEKLKTCEDVDLSYKLKKNKNKIFYDDSIEIIHHGEAKSLLGFYKKEHWRGIGNFDGIISHGIVASELPSILQIVWFMFFLLLLLIGILRLDYQGLFIAVLGLLLLPMLRSIRVCFLNKKWVFIEQIIIWFTYYIARSISMIEGIASRIIISPFFKGVKKCTKVL